MTAIDERFTIYVAMAILCSAVGAFLGAAAALWSFVQIAGVVELVYWLGLPPSGHPVEPQSRASQ